MRRKEASHGAESGVHNIKEKFLRRLQNDLHFKNAP